MKSFDIYKNGKAVPIIMDVGYEKSNYGIRSYVQIERAVNDLRRDVAMVTGTVDYIAVQRTFLTDENVVLDMINSVETGRTPQLLKGKGYDLDSAIIIGSIERSELINDIIRCGKFPEADSIRDKWEAYAIKIIENPTAGIGRALVIAGSDARGTIYGIYTLSEKIGVSPWYWFSDVGIEIKDIVTVDINKTSNGPSVKYRGIFINDEERLVDWAREQFPTKNGTPEVNFYRHVFELLLRLKANTLWPAMHEGTTSFCIAKDEKGVPVNAKEAAKYGIIMSSSHCEMMLRCNVGEWRDFYNRHKDSFNWCDDGSFDYTQNKEAILAYWKERLETNKEFESILALGIRGIHDGDAETDRLEELYLGSKVEMMADVIREQRRLIKDVYGNESAVPQVFIPYKGMAAIYNDGLKDNIPDDVMLMWAEDNYGYLRQVPTEKEKARSGGRGVYYHNSYWSWFSPKSYLWLNSANGALMAHQMKRAYDTGAGQYWILNVGDIKPGDILMEFFLKMAWDTDIYGYETLESVYLKEHAVRDFGLCDEDAVEAAKLISGFYHLSAIKKAEFYGHEMEASVSAPYFSQDMINALSVDGDEGDNVVSEARDYVERARALYEKMNPIYRDAFYQQIYYHLISYKNVCEEYVYLWKNQKAANEGRFNSVFMYEKLSKDARARVACEQEEFWNINNNKWYKVIGYDHPVSYYNMNEGVLLVHDEQYRSAKKGKGIGAVCKDGQIKFTYHLDKETFIDIFSKSGNVERWDAVCDEWIILSKKSGETDCEERITVKVDWSKIVGENTGEIKIINAENEIRFSVTARKDDIMLLPDTYIEADGKVEIKAERYTESINGEFGDEWAVIKNTAPSGDGMTAIPFDLKRVDGDDIKRSARLRYGIYFISTGEFKVKLYRLPTLNEGCDDDGESRTCRCGVGIDSGKVCLLEGNRSTDGPWKSNIMRGYELIEATIEIESAGWHDLYVYRSDVGIIFDRIDICKN